MSATLQPEFFLLLGIDLFLMISLLSCLLDKHFPRYLPYLYQVASLAGFGQLLTSKEFMVTFGEYTRFWFSLLYLLVALVNIVAVNAYLGFIKKKLSYAKTFTIAVSFPSFALSAFFLANYFSVATHPLLLFPMIPWETTFIVLFAFDTLVVALGTYVCFQPKWWHITISSAGAIACAAVYVFLQPSSGGFFVVSALALGIGCILVLVTCVFVLVRLWRESFRDWQKIGGEKHDE